MKIETESHQFSVLYAGSSSWMDYYAVFRTENGRTEQASRWFALPELEKANAAAKELGERDGVQWFGRTNE